MKPKPVKPTRPKPTTKPADAKAALQAANNLNQLKQALLALLG